MNHIKGGAPRAAVFAFQRGRQLIGGSAFQLLFSIGCRIHVYVEVGSRVVTCVHLFVVGEEPPARDAHVEVDDGCGKEPISE